MADPVGNVFKGPDREMLKKTQFLLEVIERREAFLLTLDAAVGRKSSRVSNRVHMIPAMEPVPPTGITTAITVLKDRIATLLAMQY